MPFDQRPEAPSPDLLDRARLALADRLSLNPEPLAWEVGERSDRKRSTLFHLKLRSAGTVVATAWFKAPYFPPDQQDSRHLARAREGLGRNDEMARRFTSIAAGSTIAVNETLAYDEATLEVVTLGLEGKPMGNPLRLALTARDRARALDACGAVGEAVRVLEAMPRPPAEPELGRIWEETERKLETVGPLLPDEDRRNLGRAMTELFESASADSDPVTLAHGDLSPGNVILMEERTGLVDFGWVPQLRGFDLSRFVHRLRYTTPSLRTWTEALSASVLEGYGDLAATDRPGWRFSEMQRLLATLQRLERMGEGGRRSAGRALAEIRAAI